MVYKYPCVSVFLRLPKCYCFHHQGYCFCSSASACVKRPRKQLEVFICWNHLISGSLQTAKASLFCGSIYIFLYSEICNTCLQTSGPKIYASQKPMVLESILRYGLENAAEGPWKFDVRIEGRLAHASGPD